MATKIIIAGNEYEFAPGKFTFGEATQLERVTGKTFTQVLKAVTDGSAEALQAIALLYLKRANPAARLADVEAMPMDALEVIADPDVEAREPSVVDHGDPTEAAPSEPPETT